VSSTDLERTDNERRLLESEARYRAIFDAAGDGLEVWDLETGRLLEVNPAHCRMHGYTREELLADPPPVFIHPDDAYVVELHLATVRAGGEARGRVRDLRKDGSVLPVEVVAKAFTFNGRPCMLGVLRDVSEQVQAYERLEERVARRTRELSSLLAISRSVSSMRDLHSLMEILFAQLETVVEYAEASVVVVERGRSIVLDQRGHLQHGAAFEQGFAAAMRSAEAFVAADEYAYLFAPLVTNGQAIGCLTLVHERPDYYTSSHAQLALAFAQQAASAIENAREYEQARETARRAEERYHAVFAGASDALAIFDDAESLVDVNPSMETLLGRSRDEILGVANSEIIQQDPEWIAAQFTRVLLEGQWSGELTIRQTDGTLVPVDVMATRIDESPNPLVLVAVRNISERKRSELALAAQVRLSALRADIGAVLESSGAFIEVLQRTVEALGRHYSGARVRILSQPTPTSPFEITVQAGASLQAAPDSEAMARVASSGSAELGDRVIRLPLRVDKAVAGILELEASTALDAADIQTLAAIADGIAQFEERKRAQDALERRVAERTHELKALLEASAALSSTLDMRAVLSLLLDQLRNVVRFTGAGAYVIDGDSVGVRDIAQRGDRAVHERRPVIGDDEGGSTLSVPMIARGEVIGVLSITHPQPGYYNAAHAELALAFAQQAAVALDNARLYERAGQVAAYESQERVAAEARYRGLFMGAVDALLVTAPGGTILDANPAATTLLEWSADELIGANGPKMLARPERDPTDYRTLATRGTWEGEIDLQRKNGTIIPVEVRSTRIDLPGGPIYVTVLRDVTDRRRAAELLERRVAERTAELSSLLEVAHSMGSTLEVRPLVELVLTRLKTIVDYTQAGVLVRLEDGRYQFFEYRGPMPRERVVGAIMGEIYEPIMHDLEREQRPFIRSDPAEDPPLERGLRNEGVPLPPESESRVRSQIVVPLVVNKAIRGAIILSHNQRDFYSEHHLQLTTAFAQQAAIALENARLYEAVRETAALEERQKLARELHDSVSQALYAIALNSTAAQESLKKDGPERTARLLREVRRLSRAGMAEMRALIFELRPESLTEEGLVGALTKQAAAAQARYGLRIKLTVSREPSVPFAAKEALYRISQEALQNVIKHAHARSAEIALEQIDQDLVLTVRDFGKGFDPGGSFPGHLGLRSMWERARTQGGLLDVVSAQGNGTTIRATIPVGRGDGEGKHL
jgi:PAS domain S-box-containing protein